MLLFSLFCQLTFAQRFDLTPNYDENKVPEYRLPEVLKNIQRQGDKKCSSMGEDTKTRIVEFLFHQCLREGAGKLNISKWEVVEQSNDALDGKAIRKQVDLVFFQ